MRATSGKNGKFVFAFDSVTLGSADEFYMSSMTLTIVDKDHIEQAWNGMCVEYCGTSHANMRFKAFTVTQANFESWAAHQASPAVSATRPSAPNTLITPSPAMLVTWPLFCRTAAVTAWM